MHFLVLSVLRFLFKFIFETIFFSHELFWKNSHIHKQNLYGYKPARAAKRSELERCSKQYKRNHTKQWKLFASFKDLEQVLKEIKKKRTFSWCITYLDKWKHFHRQFLLLFGRLFLSVFILYLHFCLLKPFSDNSMHSEIIARYFNIFCWNITEKTKLEKCFLGARVWAPKPVNEPPKRPGYVPLMKM